MRVDGRLEGLSRGCQPGKRPRIWLEPESFNTVADRRLQEPGELRLVVFPMAPSKDIA